MDSADQVIKVLELMLTIGPLAVYFLGLGLVSSRSHPCLVSERGDFVLLTLAFVPIISWPLVSLVSGGHYVTATVLIAALGALFITLLPRPESGWVIYNLSSQELRRALQRACGRLGWRVEYGTADADREVEAVIQPANLTTMGTGARGEGRGTSEKGSVASDQWRVASDQWRAEAEAEAEAEARGEGRGTSEDSQPANLTIMIGSMPWLRNLTLRCPTRDERQVAVRTDVLRALAGELRKEAMLPSPTGAGLVVIGAMLLGLPMWYFFHHISAIVDVVRRFLLA